MNAKPPRNRPTVAKPRAAKAAASVPPGLDGAPAKAKSGSRKRQGDADTPSAPKAAPPKAKASAPAPADGWVARALRKLRVGAPSDRVAVLGEPPRALVDAVRAVVGAAPRSEAEGAGAHDMVIAGAYLDQAGLTRLPMRLREARAALKPDAILIAQVRTFAAPDPRPVGGGAWDHLLFPAMTRSGEITGVAAGLTPLFISGWVMAFETAGFRLLALAGPSGDMSAESLFPRHGERLSVFDAREIAASELLIIAKAIP